MTAAEGGAIVGSSGVVFTGAAELRGRGTDRALLARIAATTGGVVREDLGAVFRDRPTPIHIYSPLWPSLILASILALLASVAARRWVPPRWLLRLGRGGRSASSAAPSGGPSAALEIATRRAARQEEEQGRGGAVETAAEIVAARRAPTTPVSVAVSEAPESTPTSRSEGDDAASSPERQPEDAAPALSLARATPGVEARRSRALESRSAKLASAVPVGNE